MQLQTTGSLRLTYAEWVEERIEEYKEAISRSDLLRIADDVVQDLRVSNQGQYQLTEILLLEAVDQKIFQLLKLPGFRAWCAARGENPDAE